MIDWNVHRADEKIVDSISTSFLLDPLQAKLLAVRGITSETEAARFLEPAREHLHDPFLFDEMETATSMLHVAVSSGERILVHGDYDADGICGAALLYEALLEIGADAHFFIPDRAKDGYGLARRVMERGVGSGLGLVVSVDCGSSDQSVVSYLKANGVKVIVTDHHETRGRLDEADAFLNPKLPGERYPYKELSGSGVAYKLLQGLGKRMGVDLSLEQRIDLAALGTIGDYSLLTGENRVISSLGMKEIGAWRRPGLKALRVESGLSPRNFTARKLCFTIIPRLNSPGRMGSARDVVKLLVTRDQGEAVEIARNIEEKNRRRRIHDSNVTEEACYLADIVLKRMEPSALVFSSSSWHEGVVGIGASRLAEKYNLPTVLIAVKEGVGKGSARSAGKINIKEALERCSDILIEYGGHREAGGFSIDEAHIPDFQTVFEETVGELLEHSETGSMINADAEATLDECSSELLSFIRRLAPFGPGNHEPMLFIRNVEVLQGTRVVGDGHLKLVGRDGRGTTKELIAFSMAAAWSPERIVGDRIDVLTHIRSNVYMGREEVQLQVKAIRLTEDSLL
jgi:single-stranded-DNA-specific exonuclease